MNQLFLPISGIDRRDESPRYQECAKAKKQFESFLAYRFNLFPNEPGYGAVFPCLVGVDIDTADAENLSRLTCFYGSVHEKLRTNIYMYNMAKYHHWDDLDDEEQFEALQHWVEWCDMLEDVDDWF